MLISIKLHLAYEVMMWFLGFLWFYLGFSIWYYIVEIAIILISDIVVVLL